MEAHGSNADMRRVLMRDWGVDLPLHCQGEGWGTKGNPITLLVNTPAMAMKTAYTAVHCIHRGMSEAVRAQTAGDLPSGVMWRPKREGLHYVPDLGLWRFPAERKILKEDVVTEDVGYFFRLPNARDNFFGDVIDDSPVRYLNLDHGLITLPTVIGWQHFDEAKSVDYTKLGKPNLGIGLAYSGLAAKATVYVYPNTRDAAALDPVEREFARACADVEATQSDIKAWPDPVLQGGTRLRTWMQGTQAENATALGLGEQGGLFIKFRITWVRDQIIDEAVNAFLKAMLLLIRHPVSLRY